MPPSFLHFCDPESYLFKLVQRLMTNLLWGLTAFLAVTGDFMGYNGGVRGVGAQYLLGLGIADITGPVVETNMMGYADLDQTDTGLHMRQFSRAFIVADSSKPANRVVLINSDIGMADSVLRQKIVAQLSSQFPGVYTNQNVAFVGTHSHAGVGGFLANLLPQVTSLGYVPQSANAIISGTVRAVVKAHSSIAPGRLSVGNSTVLDGNINRSPAAYLANPAAERARYQHDTDRDISVLKFDDASGKARGFMSFYPVHGTSLYGNNTLVSTDNKGMAAYLYEASIEPNAMPGNNSFVAGFVQSNVGDTSPNTLGAFCEAPGQPFDGQPCNFNTSTCGESAAGCHGRGPGFRISDFESNRIIGEKQFFGARDVMQGTRRSAVSGGVKGVHTYLNMAFHSFQLPNGTTVQTCPPALGFSFAGGTSDWPGAFDFTQGTDTSDPRNPFWDIVKGVLTPQPNEEQRKCQEPKPVLLNTGYAKTPYDWSPGTVDIQMLKVGNFVILVVPGELTTMAGRRMREALRAELINSGLLGRDAYVVVAGPGNTYGHYITTKEEYSVQRYEGASTLYGQYTLDAYIEKFSSLIPYLSDTVPAAPPSDPAPPNQESSYISLQTGVAFDAAGIGRSYGALLTDVVTGVAHRAGSTIFAVFVGANPRNNLRLGGTFLSVERLVNDQWQPYRSDSHPSTIYRWKRESTILGTSSVNISWTIESGTPAGSYRLAYFGDSKPLIGSISSFSGRSSIFNVA
ncbi:Neutral/alkaline nonlysosomal ceramidase [Pterulicium gracile]|uniref:Neutral ceramidase n=1 Tax=Pterulicium gracile TaxID=1884261 RepID=A0A5C3QAT7_9AGAR|nr:Neutral/alkaline nonlysosomal ceramidase [Pterula gracilis]